MTIKSQSNSCAGIPPDEDDKEDDDATAATEEEEEEEILPSTNIDDEGTLLRLTVPMDSDCKEGKGI
jgi:hypothetical protein